MKQYRTAAILALVVIALGAVATWDEWQTKRDETAEKAKNRLTDIKPEDVTELEFIAKAGVAEPGKPGADAEVAPAAAVDVSLVKQDGVWRMTKPVTTLADSQTVDSLLRTVTEYAYAKEVGGTPETWKDFGLAEPARQITIRTGGDKAQSLTVFVGDKAPVGYNVYLRTGRADTVYLGSQHLLVSSTKTLDDFRDKSVVKVAEKDVSQVIYRKKGDAPIELRKSGDKWVIASHESLEADTAEVRALLDELNSLRAGGFVDQPGPELQAGFADPDFQISWATDKGDKTELTFASAGGKLHATLEAGKVAFQLGAEVGGKLTKSVIDFRDRKVFKAAELEASALDIDGESFRNFAGTWYAAADADKLEADGTVKKDVKDPPKELANLRAFVVDLEFAKTDRFILPTDAEAGVTGNAPEHKIQLAYKDASKQPLVIELYKVEGNSDRFIVRRSGTDHLFLVPAAAFRSMKPGAAAPTTGEEEELPVDDPAIDEGLNLNMEEDSGNNSGGSDVSAKDASGKSG